MRQGSVLFKRIEVIARRRGLHLDELAAAAGVGTSTLYQLNNPRVSTAKAIADVLGITVDRLIAPPRRSSPRSNA
jgi:transcriptional regulator with XRE-family HTH domain